jgi:hypothetical protein
MTATTTLPTVHEIDAQLRSMAELRGLLDGFLPSVFGMQMALARREQALRDCRDCLVAHEAELAARAAAAPAVMPPEDPVTPVPAERVLAFASANGASAPTNH